ncbi:MAG: M3 family oligoendopeptidase [Ruminococcaceae bacterium]|nr:M3 family oligoendopeptidase [Oscillospiraceae bacterium]
MKFSELEYKRPDIAEISEKLSALTEKMIAAPDAKAQIELILEKEKLMSDFGTNATIASIRHTIDTRDAFYEAENDFFDENGPVLEEKAQEFMNAVLGSKFRKELEEKFGTLLFINMEMEKKTFSPEIIPLLQKENALTSEYQKLYATTTAEIDGKVLPITKLSPYKQNPDRAVRKAAYEAEGKAFEGRSADFDRVYAELVSVRTEIAHKLGYENFVSLAYDRLGRNCYDKNKVAAFRDQIAKDMVPIVAGAKERQRARIGVEKLKFYDDVFMFTDGNPKPHGTSEDILAAGKEMYHALSKETKEFIDFMYDGEFFDVLAKDGKAPGGYCTEISGYKAPFVFSNFNGTSGDVDVLTHEMGHAFAAYRALRQDTLHELKNPTMETCECHSMSMEFLTAPYHELFFKEDTKKYELSHAEDSLIFIPYGCMVDEFQHVMYERPELSPDERHEVWLGLEKKYRPYIDFDNIPFYSRGAGWQRQLHIFMYPFYYIDYCIAQTVSFEFYMLSLKDREQAWAKYLAFVDKAGTATFEDIMKSAGLVLPYEEGAIASIAGELDDYVKNVLAKNFEV